MKVFVFCDMIFQTKHREEFKARQSRGSNISKRRKQSTFNRFFLVILNLSLQKYIVRFFVKFVLAFGLNSLGKYIQMVQYGTQLIFH